MKQNIKLFFAIIGILLTIALYALFQSYAYSYNFLKTLDHILSSLINEVWKFISTPSIFLTIVISAFLWGFRDNIESIFPTIKELSAGGISAKFDFSNPSLISDKNDVESQIELSTGESKELVGPNISKNREIAAYWISKLDLKTIQFFLTLDEKNMTVREMIEDLSETEIIKSPYVSKRRAINLEDEFPRGYYYGAFRVLDTLLLDILFSKNVSNDKSTAYFKLFPDARELLLTRLEELTSLKK